jgi:uncharacterized membrane-anchored protein
MTTHPNTPSTSTLRGWRLWLPLGLQTLLMAAIPAQDAYTNLTGKTVILQTAPVDPYDLLRGYSQTLGYDISTPSNLSKLPGGDWFKQQTSGAVYVVLQAPPTAATPPKPWKPVRVSDRLPTSLPPNQIALKGELEGARVHYGLETYYMPEDQRDQLNEAISQASSQKARPFVVETKVDGTGHAVPVSLWVSDRNYRF